MDVTGLRVYQNSLNALRNGYQLVYKIPELHRKLKFQFINSMEAVPALISEGFSRRRNEKDSRRFFEIAMAESDEVITHLRKLAILSAKIGSIKIDECKELAEKFKAISRQLNRMTKVWRGSSF